MNHQEFLNPSAKYLPRPLWFWNDKPKKETIAEIMQKSKELSSYGGFGILGYDACGMKYMSQEYLDMYRLVLEKAKALELKICLYDEWWFPSGGAGGLLKEKYPQACARRLDKLEYEVMDRIDISMPDGKIMAITAMNTETLQIIDLSDFVSNGRLHWEPGSSQWRVLIFVCTLSDWDRVNYLDPEAVKKFIEMTHEVYYKHFKEYFTCVIDCAFYDEPQFYTVDGRMWTDDFNEKFIEKYRFDPSLLYPALWYDIGANTGYARNMLFGFRADLYSSGFPKVLQEWCTNHGIDLTGHVDQEEVINPVGIVGDLMKAFKYQNIPGYDEIGRPRRGSKMYKIISSAAYNWDKPLVMSECFGAMSEDLTIENMYREVMEQYSKGLNLLVPHAVWQNAESEKVVFPPELSYRNKKYAEELKNFNKYCARVQYLLQGGRHIADIAVYYPIHSLSAAYHFDWGGNPYAGGPESELFDYQEWGEILSAQIRKDFVFLHPEVLDEKCDAINGKMILSNTNNFEEFKILILPGCSTMSLSNARKLLDFYNCGGIIIATKILPEKSLEQGKDGELKDIIRQIFGGSAAGTESCGKSYFLQNYTIKDLHDILIRAYDCFDVNICLENETDGYFSYIHKVKDNNDLYFFCNAGNSPVSPQITIKSFGKYEVWNPHDGSVRSIAPRKETDGKALVNLNIPANSSLFLIAK